MLYVIVRRDHNTLINSRKRTLCRFLSLFTKRCTSVVPTIIFILIDLSLPCVKRVYESFRDDNSLWHWVMRWALGIVNFMWTRGNSEHFFPHLSPIILVKLVKHSRVIEGEKTETLSGEKRRNRHGSMEINIEHAQRSADTEPRHGSDAVVIRFMLQFTPETPLKGLCVKHLVIAP